MAKIPDRINSDEEFNDLCSRMVKGAQIIEGDPLLTSEEREAYEVAYNRMWRVIEDYRLRDRGVSYYPDEPAPPETAPAAVTVPQAEKPEESKRSAAAAWLDDDD
ncbi:hypothetical protein D3C77_697750 [compost metagenome]